MEQLQLHYVDLGVPRVMDLLKQNKMDDVLVLVGGIIGSSYFAYTADEEAKEKSRASRCVLHEGGDSMDHPLYLPKTHPQ